MVAIARTQRREGVADGFLDTAAANRFIFNDDAIELLNHRVAAAQLSAARLLPCGLGT